jgi:hypothetical protein
VSNSVSVLSKNDAKPDQLVGTKTRQCLGDCWLAPRSQSAIFCLTCKGSQVQIPVRPPKIPSYAVPVGKRRNTHAAAGWNAHLPLGMNPGMPVSTTELSLTRVLIP